MRQLQPEERAFGALVLPLHGYHPNVKHYHTKDVVELKKSPLVPPGYENGPTHVIRGTLRCLRQDIA